MAELTEEPDEDDIFSAKNAPAVTLITLLRIYDLLSVIAAKVDPERAEALLDLHEQGGLFGPAPAFDPGRMQ